MPGPLRHRGPHGGECCAGEQSGHYLEVGVRPQPSGDDPGHGGLPLRLELEAAGTDGRHRGDDPESTQHLRPLALVVGRHGDERRSQRSPWRLVGGTLLQFRYQPAQAGGVVGEDHVLLGGEVVEEGPRSDVGGGGDLVDRGAVEPSLLEEVEGGALDGAPGARLLALAQGGVAGHGLRVSRIAACHAYLR